MEQDRQKGPFEQLGQAVGGVVGGAAGRANDAALNVLGSLFGTALQQMGAWWSSPDAQRAASSFGEPEDTACRAHWEQRGRGGSSASEDYDRARPAYQFGHVASQNPEYQSKPFDQVEAELERAWEAAGRETGGWSEVRDQVSFGYTHRTPGAPNPT